MKHAPPNCAQVKKALRELGFQEKPSRRGSHQKFHHPNFRGQKRTVTVDCPQAPFDPYLVQSMAKQAGLKPKEFKDLCAGAIDASHIKKF